MIRTLWKNKSVVTFYYLLSLISALALAIPFYRTLLLETGYTLNLNPLVQGFDFMIFMDALRAYSHVLYPYVFRAFLLLATAALAATFFSGGLIDAVSQDRFHFRRFLLHSKRYWARTLGLAALLGLLSLICTLLAVLISLLTTAIVKEPDHRSAVLLHLPALLFFLLSQGFLFLLWDYSRVVMAADKNVFRALSGAFQILTRSYRPHLFFVLILLAYLAGAWLYLFLEEMIGMTTSPRITSMIFIQQAFIYGRIFLRLLHLRLASGFLNG